MTKDDRFYLTRVALFGHVGHGRPAADPLWPSRRSPVPRVGCRWPRRRAGMCSFHRLGFLECDETDRVEEHYSATCVFVMANSRRGSRKQALRPTNWTPPTTGSTWLGTSTTTGLTTHYPRAASTGRRPASSLWTR